MSQFNLVQAPARSPACCMACGSTRGPFIDFDIPFIKVATAVGIMDAEAGVYLCVGNEDNPGCIVQAARMSGLMVDTAILHDIQKINAAQRDEIAELQSKLTQKTVKLADVLPLLNYNNDELVVGHAGAA